MLPQCIVLAVLGCALAAPQYQIQEQDEGIPPHLLRQYIGTQGQAHAQSIQRQVPQAVPAPARLPYNVQGGEQYQRPQYQQGQALAPQQRPQEQRDPEDYDPNPSYQFGFDVNDDQYTNYQNRKEQRDGNVIKGSYSVVDSDGFIRTVTYTADPKEGFKAEVSRQPTDIVVKIPTPKPQIAQQQIPQHLQQQIPQHHVQQQIPQQLQQTHVLQQQRAQPQQQQQYYRYEQ